MNNSLKYFPISFVIPLFVILCVSCIHQSPRIEGLWEASREEKLEISKTGTNYVVLLKYTGGHMTFSGKLEKGQIITGNSMLGNLTYNADDDRIYFAGFTFNRATNPQPPTGTAASTNNDKPVDPSNNKTERITTGNNCGIEIKAGTEEGFITGQGVRMRSEPNTRDDSNILLKLNKDELVLILENKTYDNELWYKVCYKNQTGWISGKYIEIHMAENESD